jgi:L-aspartate oxidase
MITPRYLVPFHPKRVPHSFADILVIGGGIAGLRAALAVDPSLHVLVITKDVLLQSNSQYAQGGIAGVMDPEDRFENHVRDTLVAGAELCDEAVVEMVVREAPSRILELFDWGARFDLRDGEIHLGREGGHSHRRILHALGDATGKEIMRAIIERARKQPNIEIWENTFTLDLLVHEGACRGAIVSHQGHGKTLGRFIARQRTRLWRRGMGTRWPIVQEQSCATWSSCSFIRRCSTSQEAAACSLRRRAAAKGRI